MRHFQKIKDHTLDDATAGRTYRVTASTPEQCAEKCQGAQYKAICRAFTFQAPNVCKLHSSSTLIKGGSPKLQDYSKLYQLGKLISKLSLSIMEI